MGRLPLEGLLTWEEGGTSTRGARQDKDPKPGGTIPRRNDQSATYFLKPHRKFIERLSNNQQIVPWSHQILTEKGEEVS